MQKKINIFIIMLLISTLFFGFMSYPIGAELVTGTNSRIDWDEFVYGASSGSGTFYNWNRDSGNDFVIYNDYVNSSPKSLRMRMSNGGTDEDTDDQGSIFVSLPHYINSIHMDLELTISHTDGDQGCMRILRIYNDTDIVCQIAWKTWSADYSATYTNIDAMERKFWFYNYTTLVWDEVGSLSAGVTYDIDIDIIPNDSKEKCKITITRDGTPYNSDWLTFGNPSMKWSNITRINFYSKRDNTGGNIVGNNIEELWDDIIFSYPSAPLPPLPPTYDVSAWEYKGDMIPDNYFTIGSNRIYEEKYDLPITCEVKAVDLLVSQEQFNDDSDPSNYAVFFTRHDIGVEGQLGTVFIPYQDKYILRWYNVNHTINNTPIVFEFVHNTANEDGEFWNWIGVTESDNDGDGNRNFKYHDDVYNINQVWDGETVHGYDLNMRFYYIGDLYEPEYEYPDYIGIKDISPYYTYTNIPISYAVSTREYNNYMEIWKDGERMGYEQGFGSDGTNGKYLVDFSDTVGFVPLLSGSYSVNIRRNTVNVTAYAFTVTDNPVTDYYIYTIPNPSRILTSFNVYYKYFHGEGKDGILTLHYTQTFDNPMAHLYYTYLSANTTGNFTYTPSFRYNLLYISMGIEISTERYALASFTNNPYIQYIQDAPSSNYISVLYPIVNFNLSHTQTITGHHNHISAYVYITDNGEIIQDVGNKNTFTFSYVVINGGNHEVKLILSTINGTVVLDTEYYIASEGIITEEEEDAFESLGDYKLWLGVGILVLCLLLPLAISIKSFVDVPLIVYIAMGALGTGISVSLGLLEMYWLLLMMVALVTGAVISKWGL